MEELDEKNFKDEPIEDNKITDKILEDNKNEYNDIKNNNLTKEIEYITTNKNGDIFKIIAKYSEWSFLDLKLTTSVSLHADIGTKALDIMVNILVSLSALSISLFS